MVSAPIANARSLRSLNLYETFNDLLLRCARYYSVSEVRIISTGVGRVLFNPPSLVEWRVKENPPYAGFMESICYCPRGLARRVAGAEVGSSGHGWRG